MSNLSPEEKHRIYQEERVRAEAQQAVKAEARSKRLRGCAITFLCVIIGISTIIFGLIAFNHWSMEHDVGAEAFLGSAYFDGVQMYDSPESFHRHSVLGKEEGLKMLADGRLSYIPNKLRVRIIGTDGGLYKVEILAIGSAGDLAGKSGWVERDVVNIVADTK
jgi:hypothetical protein